MGEARSLTALSESDYEAIADAVMETARGRWFMSEFAKRNRQADTSMLLGAIARIERVMGTSAAQQERNPSLSEAAALIADLRLDLERISGRGSEPSSGLAARIEHCVSRIAAANETVQEAAWSLREAGADTAICDLLDRRSTDIHAAAATIEGTAHQINKIADTIAMLDSSLRALCEAPQDGNTASDPEFGLSKAAPLGDYEDVEIIKIDITPKSALAEPRPVPARPLADLKQHASSLLNDDIVFKDVDDVADPLSAPHVVAAATSEADLRAIDEMSTEGKLAYFV